MKEDYLEDKDDKKIQAKIVAIQKKAQTSAKTIINRIGSPKLGQK
jgi:hypothetical protein